MGDQPNELNKFGISYWPGTYIIIDQCGIDIIIRIENDVGIGIEIFECQP
jgi:hypothetical protein